jgi:hypothetical protein
MRPCPSLVRTASVLAVMLLASAAGLAAAHLSSATAAGWTAYVSATENRIERELGGRRGFLALDFGTDAAADRRAVLGGAVVMRRMETVDARGATLHVPSALVHHWRGAVFIPGTSVEQLVAQLQHGAPPTRQEDVLQSRVLERGPNRMRVFLKLRRTKFVTVVYNTEHVVTFGRHGPGRAMSASTATRIAEVSAANTPGERELPVGDDRGFLWRLNANWRYEDVAGGVIAECESLSLSRDVPSVVRYVVEPLIESTARESMERTLLALRERFVGM